MPLSVQAYDRQVFDIAAKTAGDVSQVFRYRRLDVHGTFTRWPDNKLIHVHIGGIEQAAAFGRGKNRDRIACAERTQIGAFKRVDGNIYFRKLFPNVVREISTANLFADIKHRSLVTFALADHDPAPHRDLIHNDSHRFDRHMVGVFPVALAHRLRRFDRSGLGHL